MTRQRTPLPRRIDLLPDRELPESCSCRATIAPSMPVNVLQRPNWHGRPHELGDLFILHKNRREANAVLFTHQFRWEVRLMIGAQAKVVQKQVCRTEEEVLTTGEQWKAAMGEKGWT